MIEVALEAHQADKEIWRDIVGYVGRFCSASKIGTR